MTSSRTDSVIPAGAFEASGRVVWTGPTTEVTWQLGPLFGSAMNTVRLAGQTVVVSEIEADEIWLLGAAVDSPIPRRDVLAVTGAPQR